MYGSDPSEPGRYAAQLFAGSGARRVLELGAGHGRDTRWFLRNGYSVVALDVAVSGLIELRRGARVDGTAHRLAVVAHDVRDPLPLRDHAVDCAFGHMLFSMALATDEILALGQEVRRVLQPGGRLVYTVRHVGDAHFGTGRSVGDGCFEHGGFVVHFFDQALVARLAEGYVVEEVAEFEEGELPRRLWRVTMRVDSSVP